MRRLLFMLVILVPTAAALQDTYEAHGTATENVLITHVYPERAQENGFRVTTFATSPAGWTVAAGTMDVLTASSCTATLLTSTANGPNRAEEWSFSLTGKACSWSIEYVVTDTGPATAATVYVGGETIDDDWQSADWLHWATIAALVALTIMAVFGIDRAGPRYIGLVLLLGLTAISVTWPSFGLALTPEVAVIFVVILYWILMVLNKFGHKGK